MLLVVKTIICSTPIPNVMILRNSETFDLWLATPESNHPEVKSKNVTRLFLRGKRQCTQCVPAQQVLINTLDCKGYCPDKNRSLRIFIESSSLCLTPDNSNLLGKSKRFELLYGRFELSGEGIPAATTYMFSHRNN